MPAYLTECPKTFSVALSGTGSENSSPIYRHPDFVNELKITLDGDAKHVDTLWGVFEHAAKKNPNAKCHGKRTTDAKGNVLPGFTYTTYAHVYGRVLNFASGIADELKMDVSGKLKLMGLMGGNCSEWAIAELACLGLSGCTVPLYALTPVDTLEYSLNQNGCAVVVCDPISARLLLATKKRNCPTLATIVLYGLNGNKDLEAELRAEAKSVDLNFLVFEDVEAAGKANPKPMIPPKADDIFTFIYTSGSTGMPKAAVLTHIAQVSVIAASFVNTTRSGMPFREAGEFHLSYLPAAHIMERAFTFNMYLYSCAIGYFQGKKEALIDDLANLRPTLWPSVPRLLTMLVDKIQNQVRSMSPLKQAIFNKALNAKMAGLKKGKMTHAFWDKLLFSKIKAKLGLDRCRAIVTGSAPVSGAVLDFVRAVFGIFVVEGYGASETAASAAISHPLHFSSEHVGGPSPNVEIKLVSVPELNYLVTDKMHNGVPVQCRGEVCIRGKCVMKEYYMNPEATAKALDSEGWYHSGDVGCILANGTLKIFDRIANVFKLSIGEYVAPEKSENVCTRSKYVASTFIHGDGLHKSLVGVVVLDEETAKVWAKEQGLPSTVTLAELAKNDELRKTILKDVDAVGRKSGLMSFEIPKALLLDSEPWTPDNLLTATQKMQRKKALAHYGDALAKMLEEVNH